MPKERRTVELCEYDEAGRLTTTYVQSQSGVSNIGTREARIDVIVRVYCFPLHNLLLAMWQPIQSHVLFNPPVFSIVQKFWEPTSN